MIELFAALTFFAEQQRDPYNWNMSCERWRMRAVEIMADEHIDLYNRRFLVRYLRNKVQGECPVDWSSLLQY